MSQVQAICNSLTLVLFGFGAMHSFISLLHANFLKYKIEPLQSGLLISTSSSEMFMVESICRDCKVNMMKIDLILFELDFCEKKR